MSDPYVYIFRFLKKEMAPGIPCYAAADSIYGLIDCVPTQLDSEEDVNYGIGLSDTPLASDEYHYCLGQGNPTELQLDGNGQEAWQSVMKFKPSQGTIAQAIAQHFMQGGDPVGLDCMKPLTAGLDRNLEIYLGSSEPIWKHTISGLSDPLVLPVLKTEAEGLAQIYTEQGETQYRYGLGAVRGKYNTRPIKDLLKLIPELSNRPDLPQLDELIPQTVKTETWPSTGAITSGQDNTWSVVSGSVTVSPAGTLILSTLNTDCQGLIGYTFGGSDHTAQFTTAVTTPGGTGGNGVYSRCDAAISNGYLMYNAGGKFASYKKVSGGYTNLSGFTGTIVANDVLLQSIVGSTLLIKQNGTQRDSRTDTAVSTGTRSATYQYSNNISVTMGIKTVVFDDLISATGRPFPMFMPDTIGGNIRQGMRGI